MDLCPESLWEELCREDTSGTFYQTPAWLRIGARHYQAEIAPLLFRCDGVPACLPLLKKRRWGVDRYFSPFGTYGALLCRQTLAAESLRAISRQLGRLNLHLISSPFTGNQVGAGKPMPAKVQVIDLSKLDVENPMRDWEEGQRRRVRVARREGVNVRTTESPQEWDRYYELYLLSLKRWGKETTLTHPRSLFEDIRQSLSHNTSMQLWVAEHNGKIGAGYLTFYHGRHVVPWHGAADESFFQLGATQTLFVTMITDAIRRGFSIFDLTGSGGLTGVESFKSRFGTHALEFASYLNRPGLLGFLAGIRDSMLGHSGWL